MRKKSFKLFSIVVAAALVSVVAYSCSSSGGGGGGGGGAVKVSATLTPSSGASLSAVNINSMFYEQITLSPTSYNVDPNSVSVSISPAIPFTYTVSVASGAFGGYINIVPTGFLAANAAYTVTTNFNAVMSNGSGKTPQTVVTTFTTGTMPTGIPTVLSYIVKFGTVIEPPGLASTLQTLMESAPLALEVLSGQTVSFATGSFPNQTAPQMSMLLYGGVASNTGTGVTATDISSTATLPFTALTVGNEVIASGSVTLALSLSGILIPIPLQTVSISAVLNPDGTMSYGTFYGVVHCVDSSCSNLGATAGAAVGPYIDANNNMAVLVQISSTANEFKGLPWITGSDTTGTTLINGAGAITTATLDVTTTGMLLTTPTLPELLLTSTDSNNVIHLDADTLNAPWTGTTHSPVSITYYLLAPNAITTPPYTTVPNTPYAAYYMFGLTPALKTPVTP